MTTDETAYTLEDKVIFLKNRDSYPGRPRKVEAIETHMSWVFLTDVHAFKLKKPVRRAYLDFTTLKSRQADCEAEVRLNRRLAGDIYIDTVPLGLTPRGALGLFSDTVIVDWLVQMRRLPAARMLDNLIRQGRVEESRLDDLVRRLIDFFAACRRELKPLTVWQAQFEQTIETDRRELLEFERGVPRSMVDRISDVERSFLARRGEIFDERRQQLRDGHGDLRPEHICLLETPVVIDCLEFSSTLRCLDPVEELSFLGLECEFLGGGWVGEAILAAYQLQTGDSANSRIRAFYKSTRAMLRAKLSVQHLNDIDVREPEKWLRRMRHYLKLAARYSHDLID